MAHVGAMAHGRRLPALPLFGVGHPEKDESGPPALRNWFTRTRLLHCFLSHASVLLRLGLTGAGPGFATDLTEKRVGLLSQANLQAQEARHRGGGGRDAFPEP